MKNWIGSMACAFVGVALLFFGLQVPAHLRAVDPAVLQRAAASTPTVAEEGITLVGQGKLGSAKLFLAAAQRASLPRQNLEKVIEASEAEHKTTAANFGLGKPFTEYVVNS